MKSGGNGNRLPDSGAGTEKRLELAVRAARTFVDRHYRNGEYDRGAIALLLETATASDDPALSAAAANAFFGIVIERLCDDYEELQLGTYNRVMAQAISHCRRLPRGSALDDALRRFGLESEQRLVERAARVHTRPYRLPADANPDRILFLSRVTIGADVAIVSVMLQRLARRFPGAELVVLGSPKLGQIFGGHPKVRIRELAYARRGGLLERLDTWLDTLRLLEEETPTAGPEAMLIVDPDSRISQLGLFPLSHGDNYLYFNSHDNTLGEHLSMAGLTNAWLDRLVGATDFAFPRVWLPPEMLATARRLATSLRRRGCRRLTAVNLGVGGNARKRLGIAFETELVCGLLREPGTVIFLDKGFGEEELAASRAILAEAARRGHPVREGRFGDPLELSKGHGVLGMVSGIGEMAALIALSDDYLGYDSACQHIAAALAVPTLTVFTGTDNQHFIRRWSACGNTACGIVHVKPDAWAAGPDPGQVARQVIGMRNTVHLRQGIP